MTKEDIKILQSLSSNLKVTIDLNVPVSNPMSFWTEQDVLHYIYKNQIDYASCYGEIKQTLKKHRKEPHIECIYSTTGCQRTGCIFCLFGIVYDRNRILRLEETEPKLAKYLLNGGTYDANDYWVPTEQGLGLSKVLDYLRDNGMEIPY